MSESSRPVFDTPAGFSGKLPILVINLDRAYERMADVARNALENGLAVERIPGVDGKAVARARRVDVDEARFFQRNGRTLLDGEYGCYRSHLAAFSWLLHSGLPAAIVIEDDVALRPDIVERAQALLDMVPSADVIKLVNHRAGGFRPVAVSPLGDRIGRCLFGPQGSAACYLVTREGAKKLLSGMQVMDLPFDMALERGWATGAEIFTVERNIADFGSLREATTIGTRADYRAVKVSHWQRLPAYLFRLGDAVSRFVYALRKPSAKAPS